MTDATITDVTVYIARLQMGLERAARTLHGQGKVGSRHVWEGDMTYERYGFEDCPDPDCAFYRAALAKPMVPDVCQYHSGHGDCLEPHDSEVHGERPRGQLGGVHRFTLRPTDDPWSGPAK